MKKIVAIALVVVVFVAGLVCAVGIAAATFAPELSGTVVVKDVVVEKSAEVTTERNYICDHVDNVPKVAELYLDNNIVAADWEVFSPAGNYTTGFCETNIESVEEALAALKYVPENYDIVFEGNVVSRSEAKEIIKQFFN